MVHSECVLPLFCPVTVQSEGMNTPLIYSMISRPARRGFTLIELLIAIAVIAILTSLILMGVHNVRERAKIQYCQNNLREIGMAFNHYTYLWEGRLPPTTGVDDDNLRPLYPDCIDSLDAFECGETANEVYAAVDLEDNAVGGRTSGRGHKLRIPQLLSF